MDVSEARIGNGLSLIKKHLLSEVLLSGEDGIRTHDLLTASQAL